MSPTPRAAVLVALLAALALVLPVPVAVLGVVVAAAATLADAASVRRDPQASRRLRPILARGVPSQLSVEVAAPGHGGTRVRQPVPPDFDVEPAEAEGGLHALVTPRRRGRHAVVDPVVRLTGPFRPRCCGR